MGAAYLEYRSYGADIDRRHKIWEVYLQRRPNERSFGSDEAETMEHFLTPEIEEEILRELGCVRGSIRYWRFMKLFQIQI